MVTLNEDLPSRDEPMPEDTSFQHHEVSQVTVVSLCEISNFFIDTDFLRGV